MKLAWYFFIFYSSFVSAQDIEIWDCESVLTTGIRQSGDEWESFATSGDDWRLRINGANSIMTRNNSSDFTIYCDKTSAIFGRTDCTGPNGVTIKIDTASGIGALSDTFFIAGGPSDKKAFLSILNCVQAQSLLGEMG
jgi:hypothetical protein